MGFLKQSFLLFLALSYAFTVGAQPFSGNWQGTLASPQNQAHSYPSTLALRVDGAKVTGTILMQGTGVTDTYVLQGSIQGNQAAGTATYPTDGTVFQFEAMITNGQLIMAIGQNKVASMAGTFVRADNSTTGQRKAEPTVSKNVPADGLARNTRLTGTWATTSYYGSSGFSSSVRTTLIFFPDGRMGSGGSSANASYEGAGGSSNVNSSGNGVEVAEGVSWYTKGDQIWLHATRKNIPDEVFGKFSIADNGRNMLLYRGNGKKIYERVN